jgi:hypothetical protein
MIRFILTAIFDLLQLAVMVASIGALCWLGSIIAQ